MGGHGTGVLRAYYMLFLIRGLTVGIAGTCCLYIARNTGVRQNYLVAARGVGTTIAPALIGRLIGYMVNKGEAQTGVALALALKMLCEVAIPRVQSSSLVFSAFFGIGVAMAVLDTMGTVLIGRVHGKKCGAAFVVYDTAYGIGCMVAPFIVVHDPPRAWDVLAAADLLVFLAVAGKRTIRGKPSGWERKLSVSSISSDGSASSLGVFERRPPARVVRAGLAFTFVNQATMTAVSCWGFTYAAVALELPAQTAARVPATFYAASVLARMVMIPVTKTVPPAAIMHFGTMLTVVAAVGFYILDGILAHHVHSSALVPMILLCFAVMGAGFCPHHSLMIAAMQQHGDLTPQDVGWYGTSTCLGITMGMWLPGYLSLPIMELVGSAALLLIINSQVRDFPRGCDWGGAAQLLECKGL